MTSTHDQLASCITTARRMRSLVAELVGEGTHLPEIAEDGAKLASALDGALHRLEHPTLVLATVGTTSAGKSTVLNAMLGRELAPSNPGETSAGTLTIRHVDGMERVTLRISATEGASWETGEWHDLTDDQARQRADAAMKAYFSDRLRQSDLLAPDIRMETSVLPGNWAELLDLPAFVGVEFIDLPGLKSVNDKANLSVIQSRVEQAVCLVVLDFGSTDPDTRAELLGQLRETVQAFGGRTDTLLFTLNRVDLWNAGQQSVADRLAEFAAEVGGTLGLPGPPILLPTSARGVFLAQCAWGPDAATATRRAPMEHRDERLRWLLQGATEGWLRGQLRRRPEFKAWFVGNDIETKLESGQLSDEEHRYLLLELYDCSGLREVWAQLRERVADRLSVLLIRPAVQSLLKLVSDFLVFARSTAAVRSAQSLDELKAAHRRLSDEFASVRVAVNGEGAAFEARLGKAVELLTRFDDKQAYDEAIALLPEFRELPGALREVKRDLRVGFVDPARSGLEAGQSLRELTAAISSFASTEKVENFIHAYDQLTRGDLAYAPEHAKGQGMRVQSRVDDLSAVHKLDRKGLEFLVFNRRARECLRHRAEWSLQVRQRQLEQVLLDTLRVQTATISERVRAFVGTGDGPDFVPKEMSAVDLQLPADLFAFPEEAVRDDRRREQTGSKTSSTGGCCPENVTTPEYGQVAYRVLELPSAVMLADRWMAGIGESELRLWHALIGALKKASAEALSQHLSMIAHAEACVELAATARRAELATTAQDSRAYWQGVEAAISALEQGAAVLGRHAGA